MAGYPEHRGPNHPPPQRLEKREERDLRPSLGPGMWRRWQELRSGRWPVSYSCQTAYPELARECHLCVWGSERCPHSTSQASEM